MVLKLQCRESAIHSLHSSLLDSIFKENDSDDDAPSDGGDPPSAVHAILSWIADTLDGDRSQLDEEMLAEAVGDLNRALEEASEADREYRFSEIEAVRPLFDFFCSADSLLLQQATLGTMRILDMLCDDDVVFVGADGVRKVAEIALSECSTSRLAQGCLSVIGTPRMYGEIFTQEEMMELCEQCKTNEDLLGMLVCFKEYSWFFGSDERLSMAIEMLQHPSDTWGFHQTVLEFIRVIAESTVPLKPLDSPAIKSILHFVFLEPTSSLASDVLLALSRRENMVVVMRECCGDCCRMARESTHIGMNYARFFVRVVDVRDGIEFGHLLEYLIREGTYEERVVGIETATAFFNRSFSGTSIMRGFVEAVVEMYDPEDGGLTGMVMNILCGIVETTPEDDEVVGLIREFVELADEEEYGRELFEIRCLLERRCGERRIPSYERPV